MGVVYEAYDTHLQSVVALKVLRSHTASSLLRFKQEFRSLADVLHPNLVTLYDLVADEGRWTFTMELVHGTDLMSHVRDGRASRDGATPSGAEVTRTVATGSASPETSPTGAASGPSPATQRAPLSAPAQFERLRASFAQLCDGVEAIHAYGYLHRDLKPSNVLVEHGGRVVVLDFGIIESIARSHASGEVVGTAAYLAPEVAAGQAAAHASDWYAVGVMLFEAITGTRPFAGDSKTVLATKCGLPAPPCRKLAPKVPDDLADLCDGLLAIEPEDRPDVAGIRQGLTHSAAAAPARPRSVFAPRFVGRRAERSRLDTALEAVKASGRSRCVRVHGVSGMGKSALVESFLRDAAAAGALVLTGRCRPHEVVPYKALDGLVDSIATALTDMPPDRVAQLLPADIRAAAQLFPVLGTVEAIAAEPAPAGNAAQSAAERRRRGFAALHRLLSNLAEDAPLILHVDDVQWGDRDSARALVGGLGARGVAGLLLLVSYRTDEAEASAFLRKLDTLAVATDEVEIGALEPGDALELASACLRAHGGRPSLAEEVVAEAGGSPLLLAELAASAAQRDSLSGGAMRLSDLVAERVEALPPEARLLMDVLSVAGTHVDRSTALAAAGITGSGHVAIKALTAARLARRWQTPKTDAIETYHDRIREAHASTLGARAAAQRHRDLAVALEDWEPDGVEALAVHWERAGEAERAAGYYERAGERAAAALAFERAVAHFEHTIALAPLRGAGRTAVYAKLANALSDGGESGRAAEAFGEAADSADASDALRYRAKQAEELLRSSRIDEGLDRLREVLAAIGEPLPKSRAALFGAIGLQRLRIGLWGAKVSSSAGELDSATEERLELYRKTLTSLAWVDPVQALAVQGRYLRAALKVGDPRHAAIALAAEANFQALAGPKARNKTASWCRRALEQAERAEEPLANFYAAYSAAFMDYQSGDYRGSRPLFANAGDYAASVPGAHWEVLKAHEGVLWCDFFLGAYGRLSQRVARLHVDALAHADLPALMTLCTGVAHSAWLVEDKAQAGREVIDDVEKRWSYPGFHLVHYWALYARVQVDLYEGESQRGHAAVEQTWSALRKSGLLRIVAIAREARHIRARAAIAAAATAPPDRARELLRIAERTTDRLARDPTPLAGALAAAKRAAIARLRGDQQAAATALETASQLFDACACAGYAVSARRHLGSLLGGDRGRALVVEADAWLRSESVAQPKRFAAMLLPGFLD